ncbi:MAG: hypothetical protein Q7S20_08565 [Gemmatimonadaceae bacterium]|nr:hypothetical protein [Gemmatimonadaceae bacterium]
MRRTAGGLLFTVVLAACGGEAVQWSDIVYSGAPPEPLDAPAETVEPSLAAGACRASLRIASAGGDSFATWWQVRQDSSVMLMVSRAEREPGVAWSPPVIADSTDHGVRGCGRPAPAIAADAVSGYVHLAYFAEPTSGAGLFFAHSMDSAASFHSPVPIVYGENPSRVSVAAEGDRVAVAYEDPNAGQPLIGIALSATMGHIFENRLNATSDNGRARQPVVRLAGDSIRLWWREYSPSPTVNATRPMYRAGRWD